MRRVAIPYLVFILMIFALKAESQSIKEFYIECDANDFEYMYENYNENIYIPVLLIYNGNSWTDVRMRIRGDSSREYPKKSLKVVFDADPFITGQDVLNFNADYSDSSYLNSVLSSRLFNDAGIDCAKMEHIRLYLNGSFYGLYILTENMDENFLEACEYDISGNLYKASKDGACLSIFDNIFYHWDEKLDNSSSRDDLAELIFSLNHINTSYSIFLQSNFVYSQVVNFLAINMLLANGSTYYHNYYLYNDANNTERWLVFPWDLDRTFTAYSKWYPYHRSSGCWTPDNPLLEKSIIDEDVFFDIKDGLAVLKNTLFNENYLFPIIDSLCNVIEPSVLEDTTDLIPDLETWNMNVEQTQEFITARYYYLTNQINNYPYSFEVHRLSDNYLPNEPIQFSWNSTSDPNGDNVSYNLYYGRDVSFEDSTTTTILGIIDTIYTINNLSNEGEYYFKVEATDNSHVIPGFDTYNIFYISYDIPNIVINEINYKSSNEFDPEDWLEFYNSSDTVVNLSGWCFKDENNQHVFYFPEGTTIDSKGYKVLCKDTSSFLNVFPDTIPVIGNMDFGLSSSGELLRLIHYSGYLVDSLVYENDFPWPSEPNGEGPTLELLNPGMNNAIGFNWNASVNYGTPGKQNSFYSPDSYSENFSNPLILRQNYPNPFTVYTDISYELKKTSVVQLKVYNSHGVLVVEEFFNKQKVGNHTYTWSPQDLIPGIYYYLIIVDGKTIKSNAAIKK